MNESQAAFLPDMRSSITANDYRNRQAPEEYMNVTEQNNKNVLANSEYQTKESIQSKTVLNLGCDISSDLDYLV